MSDEFECLKNYNSIEDTSAQRERAVRAALIILNTAVSSNQGLIHTVADQNLISKVADKIESALNNNS